MNQALTANRSHVRRWLETQTVASLRALIDSPAYEREEIRRDSGLPYDALTVLKGEMAYEELDRRERRQAAAQ